MLLWASTFSDMRSVNAIIAKHMKKKMIVITVINRITVFWASPFSDDNESMSFGLLMNEGRCILSLARALDERLSAALISTEGRCVSVSPLISTDDSLFIIDWASNILILPLFMLVVESLT